MESESYVFIRLYATPEDFEGDPERPLPYYPYYEVKEEGGVEWKLTRDCRRAAIFLSLDLAKRVVRDVPVVRSRIDRAWGFEIIRLTEEILDSNFETNDTDNTKETAA